MRGFFLHMKGGRNDAVLPRASIYFTRCVLNNVRGYCFRIATRFRAICSRNREGGRRKCIILYFCDVSLE